MNHPIPFGKYYLLDRINAGGMAEVFRAKAFGVEGFERIVAVKRILPSIAADTDFITMFIDEAKLAVQLNHANIGQIFDLGKVSDSYFIALEYVHGKDVRALFDDARKRGVRLPVGLAGYVMMKACEGLDYAHNKRDGSGRPLELVHRDVSPQNLLVSFDGDVKLIDFGIAKAVGKVNRTRAGILKGKFGYLSPEQVRGEPVDRRSDLFAAGIVLYELLTGERLFAGDSDFSAIEKVRSVEISTPERLNPDIPPELSAIVMRALARDRDVRFQTAMEMHDALQHFLAVRGEPFARRELSAYMRAHFPEEAEHDQEALGDLQGVDVLTVDTTDVTPVVEPTESRAVIDETREIPNEGSVKHPSTLLGMPVPVRPSAGRSVPPPPPRGGDNGASAAGRQVPPPARTVPPPAPPARTAPPPARTVPPPPPSKAATIPPAQAGGAAIPSMAARPATVPPALRSAPPMPPRTLPPGAAGSMYAAPSPAAVVEGNSNPLLDMDWDDEELSTQVYDKPEDQSDEVPTGVPYDSGPIAVQVSPSSFYPNTPTDRNQFGQPGQYAQDGAYGQFGQGAQFGQPNQYAQAQVQTYVPPPADYQQSYGSFTPEHLSAPSLANAPAESRVAQVTHAAIQTQGPTERGKTTLYAMAVGGVVMLCFFAYLFLAKTEPGVVQLTTHPTDATVLFDGRSVGASSPFLVTGVVPGEKHRLEVQKAGYRAWSQDVQVQPGQTLQFPVSLQPESVVAEEVKGPLTGPTAGAVGAFIIESTPPGAKVFLDGQDLTATTPVRIGNLLPRAYQVRLVLDGYRDQTLAAQVQSAMDVTLPRIALQPSRVHLRIVSDPGGAEATIARGDERRELGRTPVDVTIDNEGAQWTLAVAKPGFEAFTQPLAFEGAQKDLTVRANLARSGGGPVIAGTPAPSTTPTVQTPGSVVRPTRRPPTIDVSQPREPVVSAPSAGGGTGTLRINSRPWSQVTVDGKAYGNTPQMNISLSAGAHKVVLVNPEFSIRKTVTVQIKPGQTETQIITLQ